MLDFYRKVIQEDLDLCNLAQQNLSRGVYVSGPLHPFHEEGVLAFQGMVTDKLVQHLEEERIAGKEIWPVARQGKEKDMINETHAKILACQAGRAIEW